MSVYGPIDVSHLGRLHCSIHADTWNGSYSRVEVTIFGWSFEWVSERCYKEMVKMWSGEDS